MAADHWARLASVSRPSSRGEARWKLENRRWPGRGGLTFRLSRKRGASEGDRKGNQREVHITRGHFRQHRWSVALRAKRDSLSCLLADVWKAEL